MFNCCFNDDVYSLLNSCYHSVLLYVAAIASAAYEKLCVLFTIGAMQTQVANVQDMKTDDGLKTAAKLFQVTGQRLILVCRLAR